MTDFVPAQLFDAKRGMYFVPVRHHSPACGHHVATLVREVRPRRILIECPIDFEPLIPLLLDEDTKPPVAIVAFPQKADSDGSRASYYPFSVHAPEFVALREGAAIGAEIGFVDLASNHRVMLAEDDGGVPRNSAFPLITEAVFDSSRYVRELCLRTGCRDRDELWDHLFEQRIGHGGWRDFFASVGAYCAHVRAATPDRVMERDGTHPREAHMAACVKTAAEGGGPILVLTGGFHTPALMAALDGKTLPGAATEPRHDASPSKAYVIRYGFEQLEMLNGYAAGLPSPAYYAWVWEALERDAGGAGTAAIDWRALAAQIVTGFAAHLRARRPTLAPPLPALSAAVEMACRLADLRGHAGPARQDLIDACAASFVKGELTAGSSPSVEELRAYLTGTALGDVPASAGSPPLVEAARATARRLGLNIDDATRRNRELDIHRNERHRQASRFLHAMSLLGASFAERTTGPDILSGVDLDLLFENWSYAWSPLVESCLIRHAASAETLEDACLHLLRQEAARLVAEGQGASAEGAIRLLLTACRVGLQARTSEVLPLIDTALGTDADLASVTKSLKELFLLWRARAVLGLLGAEAVERLIGVAYRRAILLLEHLPETREERLDSVVKALSVLREVVSSAAGETREVDADLLGDVIRRLTGRDMAPRLSGAVAALAFLMGVSDGDSLIACVRGHLRGGFQNPADSVAALGGMLAVSPEAVWRVDGLLPEMDKTVTAIGDERFIELLPHLRLAFTGLNPKETDRVAATIAALHSQKPEALVSAVSYDIGEAEVAANLRLGQALAASFRADGLGSWIEGDP